MNELAHTFPGLIAIATIMVVIWFVSVFLRNVGVVDMFWGVIIATAGLSYWLPLTEPTTRANLVVLLAALWALRLFVHLFRRGRDGHEDRRYAAMRRKHDPVFWLKSLYLVFGLQALIAWVISWPLYGAIVGAAPLGVLDYIGAAVFVLGFGCELLADLQLENFLASRERSDEVMRHGLWRFSRHPNYFGEACLWWGFWLLAAGAGAWWTIISPLIMTFLLVRVSGVRMLEATIVERRPAYADYIRDTSAFLPLPPKRG